MNQFVERARFYHITIRAARIAASEVVLVVGGGKDNGGDRREAGIRSEPFQEVAAILAAEVQIQQNKRGEGVREAWSVSCAR